MATENFDPKACQQKFMLVLVKSLHNADVVPREIWYLTDSVKYKGTLFILSPSVSKIHSHFVKPLLVSYFTKTIFTLIFQFILSVYSYVSVYSNFNVT